MSNRQIAPIYFLTETDASQVSDTGDIINLTKERKIVGTELFVSQTEFYQSNASGFKPEIKLEVRVFQYKDEQKLKYKGLTYRIIRTFIKKDKIELVCTREIQK